jgi:hypothetical protein
VLLIGGYGGFGARIALRLRDAGFEVLVAGRRLAKAEAFCKGEAGLVPVEIDRGGDVGEALRRLGAWAVVDAAGPFQSSDYRVPEAAIEARCHYLDIADGRAFVGGINVLDGAAREAGVVVISGASSLPALSGAAASALAEGLDEVRIVEIVLSASSRGTAGASVARAVLSYLGRPFLIWRGGRWSDAYGWQEVRRRDFAPPGLKPLRRRLVALADVPDLDSLPERLSGRPATVFRAGTDMASHSLGLWLLSWPVRWSRIGGAERWAPLLTRVQRATGWASSARSAMSVRLVGLDGAGRVERRWTLIAERGDGPEIPALAVPVLLSKLARGELRPGARDAGTELRLGEFEPSFQGLAVRHVTEESRPPPPLYARIMGERFERLPEAVRQIHSVAGDAGASGRATVSRGKGLLARIAAMSFRFPDAGEHELHVAFEEEEEGGAERWTRSFSGRGFSSRLSERRGLLVERFGPLRFGFELPSDEQGLRMVLRRWWLGPLPLPLRLAPVTCAREWEEGDCFHFDVSIALPVGGPIVRYQGWLRPGGGPA